MMNLDILSNTGAATNYISILSQSNIGGIPDLKIKTNINLAGNLNNGDIPDETPVNTDPVDGVCGSDHGKNSIATPMNLCTKGTPSLVIDNGAGNTYTWNCNGINS